MYRIYLKDSSHKVLKKKLSQRRLIRNEIRNKKTKKYFNMKSQQTSTRVEHNKQCNKKE